VHVIVIVEADCGAVPFLEVEVLRVLEMTKVVRDECASPFVLFLADREANGKDGVPLSE